MSILFRNIFAGFSALVLIDGTYFTSSSNAYAQTAAASGGNCPYWIDVKTGEPIPPGRTVPIGVTQEELYRLQVSHSVQAHGASGRNYFRQPDGSWTDAATGQQLPPAQTVPIGVTQEELYRLQVSHDVRAHGASGRNYALIPCPPPTQSAGLPTTPSTSWTGAFIGGQLAGSFSHVGTSEFFALTGARTNQFSDSGSSFGGGINFGYNWQPWGNTIVVGAVFDINGFNDKVDHAFTGGTFIGSTVDVTGSAQIRAGVLATPSLLIYGQTGLNVAGQRLQINFGGPVTDENKVTPGYTLGAGAEFMLPMSPFPGIGASTSLFIDYDHTWWTKAELDVPVASPFFNYTWRRESDVVKGGFRIRFGN